MMIMPGMMETTGIGRFIKLSTVLVIPREILDFNWPAIQ